LNKRFKPSDWLLVGGGLLMFMASVLPWWEVSWGGQAPQATFDAFDFTATGVVPLVLFLAVAIVIVIIKTESLALPRWLVHPVLISGAIGIGSVLVAVRFVWSGFDETQGVTRGIGLYVAGVAVLLCIAGCVLSFREGDALEPSADDNELGDDFDFDDDDDDEDEDAADDVYGYADEDNNLISRYIAPPPGMAPAPDAARLRRTPTAGETPRSRRTRERPADTPLRARRRSTPPPGP
jgi:hypothetical protein